MMSITGYLSICTHRDGQCVSIEEDGHNKLQAALDKMSPVSIVNKKIILGKLENVIQLFISKQVVVF